MVKLDDDGDLGEKKPTTVVKLDDDGDLGEQISAKLDDDGDLDLASKTENATDDHRKNGNGAGENAYLLSGWSFHSEQKL